VSGSRDGAVAMGVHRHETGGLKLCGICQCVSKGLVAIGNQDGTRGLNLRMFRQWVALGACGHAELPAWTRGF
jgi:hypothetical protein